MSRWIHVGLLFIALFFGVLRAASAVTLTTPLLTTGPGGQLRCEMVNVSAATLSVKIAMVNGDGTIVGGAPAAGTLEPGKAGGFRSGACTPTAPNVGCASYCRFTAPRKGQIRAAIVSTARTDSLEPAAALPAQ